MNKDKYYDYISKNYYEKNFGKLSKSEFELSIFGMFYEDNKDMSDFDIAKRLGITPAKVHNLIFKYQLSNGNEISIEKVIEDIINRDSIEYVKKQDKIVITIANQMMFCELEDYIEKKGGYVEKQMNNKVFQITPHNYYLLLENIIESSGKKEQIQQELKRNFKQQANLPKNLSEYIEMVCKVTGNIDIIVDIISGGATCLVRLLPKIIEKINKNV